MVNKGDKAPDFILKDQNNNDVKLSDFRDKKVLLSFHPMAWTRVCGEQMKSLEASAEEFQKLNTVALGISIDTIPSKKAWAEELCIITTKLLSDFWPHGAVAKSYGIFRDKVGTSERVNIVIDEKGVVVFFKIYDISQLPDINEVIDFLKKQKGEKMSEDTKAKLDALLMDAMNAEAKARDFYKDAAHKAASAAGKNLFKELADFEQGHYDRLHKFIEARNKGMKIEKPSAQEITVKSEVEGEFEPNKDEITKVLTMGIEAEKKAQEKYLQIAKMFTDEESKTIFNNMAEEERKHQNILEDQFYSMSNEGKIIWGD